MRSHPGQDRAPGAPASGIDRRTFLVGALAGLCAGCATGAPRSEPRFSISLAEWSFHRRLSGEATPALDHLEFPATARRLGIDACEYVNVFFGGRGADAAYLRDLKARADGEGVRSLLIMCDREGRIGDPDPAARRHTVENHRKWLEAASALGCHSIRVNAASAGAPAEQADLAADGLRQLTELAAPHGLNVLVENHGGLSSDGSWLVSVMRKVAHPRCGTLPDFGNFTLGDGREYDRYLGVAQMMPFAKAVSAKSYDFDASGAETRIDYPRMLRIVADAGYHGHVGIEYEGTRLPEEDGVRATQRLLERLR